MSSNSQYAGNGRGGQDGKRQASRHIERRPVTTGRGASYEPVRRTASGHPKHRSRPSQHGTAAGHAGHSAHTPEVKTEPKPVAQPQVTHVREIVPVKGVPHRQEARHNAKRTMAERRQHYQAMARKAGQHVRHRKPGVHLHKKVTTFAKTMFRIRHYIQFAIVISCLSWGGYQVTQAVLAHPAENNSKGPTVVADGQTLDSQYPGLPTDVAAMVKSVVATQRITSGGGHGTQTGLAGSGVAIAADQILTAGHNVEDDGGLSCSQTLVVSSGVLSSASATKDLVTHASVQYGKGDDIAVLTLSPSANFQSLPHVKLAKHHAQPGETVYFINFQPDATGKGRTPLAADAAYAEPVIFSATVLGESDHGIAIAAGGGKSFGRGVPDTMLRKGASGGAVVNAKGELLGLSVASESLAADRTAASLLKEYDVNLDPGNYQVVYMQPADQSLVSRLQSGMVSCAGTD